MHLSLLLQAFRNHNTNDIMPQHFAIDDAKMHKMASNDTVWGSAPTLPWNLSQPTMVCHLGPQMRLVPPDTPLPEGETSEGW